MWDRILLAMFWGLIAGATLHASRVHAALEIFICGHSEYICKSGEGSSSDHPLVQDVRAVEIDPTDVKSVLPLRTDVPLPTPSGWTAPTAPSLEPIPPESAGAPELSYTNVTSFETTLPGPYGSGGAACSAMDTYLNAAAIGCAPSGTFTFGTVSYDAGVCTVAKTCSGGGDPYPNIFYSVSEVNLCPAGYTNSSGMCTLTDAELVQKPADGVCGVTRSGNTFVTDANDPDCTGAATNVTGGTGTASEGGVTVSVELQGDGRALVTDSRPSLDGNTQVTRIGMSAPDGSGNVVYDGWSRNWTTGTGTESGEGAVTGSCGAPGQPACKIDETGTPTDSGSLTSANSSLDTAESSGVSSIETYSSSAKRSDLGVSLSVTWPDVSCSNPQFDVIGHTLTVRMCEYESDIQSIMSWLVYVLGAFTVFGMIREVN